MLNTSRALLLLGLLGSSLASAMDYRIETVTEGLEHPWSMAFLPDGRMLVTERVGRLRIIEQDGSLNPQPVGASQLPVRISQRLVVNFYTAKRMWQALGIAIQRHEQAFGPVETDIQKRAAARSE